MMEKESPGLAATSTPGGNKHLLPHHTKTTAKWMRVLAAFLGGRTFNRFEAERELHDHCLHSTVSFIERKGVVILRRSEVVSGFHDIPTHVCRYWLAPESRRRAAELIGGVTPRANATRASGQV